jgi:hypothetical protein
MGHARYTGARIGIREGLDRWGLSWGGDSRWVEDGQCELKTMGARLMCFVSGV